MRIIWIFWKNVLSLQLIMKRQIAIAGFRGLSAVLFLLYRRNAILHLLPTAL